MLSEEEGKRLEKEILEYERLEKENTNDYNDNNSIEFVGISADK